MRPLSFLLIIVYLFSGSAWAKGSIGYIDGHNHLGGRFPSSSGFISDYQGAAKAALRAMERFGIKGMIIMPPPFPLAHPGRYDIEDLQEVVKRYPKRFALLGGGGTLNVMIQKALRRGYISDGLRRRFKRRAEEIISMGALGFGEMGVEHLCLGKRHNYHSAPPDHPLLLLLADIAAKFGVPIDIHMEAVPERMPLPERLLWLSPPNPKVLSPNIQAFERLLEHNRGAKIIWAHAGWDNTGYRTVPLMRRLLRDHPNLYMSIEVSPRDSVLATCPLERGQKIKPEWMKLLQEFPDRFFIGSDQFYLAEGAKRQIGPPTVGPTHRFFSLLPSDLAYQIGLKNPAQIFGLKKEISKDEGKIKGNPPG